VDPVQQVTLQGRIIQQRYDASDIFDEPYEEFDDEESAVEIPVVAAAPVARRQDVSATTPAPVVAKKPDTVFRASVGRKPEDVLVVTLSPTAGKNLPPTKSPERLSQAQHAGGEAL
jgi:hypothetical protein